MFGSLGFLPLACGFAQEIEPKKEEPSSQGKELKEVVVTSDLWQTLLTDIPASVTVFDSETLKNPNIRHFGDLIERTPNLTFAGGTSRPRFFQLRGIGENSQFEGETPDSAVSFLMDDIDFTGIASVASAFDVEQVEVLRGPQAGAFGVNAAAGMVRMVSVAPTPYWTGRTEVTAGQESLFAAGLAFGGPLIERNPEELMFRFSMYHNQNDNFRKNVFLNEDTNAQDEWTSRLRLTWNPSADLRVDTTLFHAYLDNGYDEFALDNNGRNTFSDQLGRDFQRSTGGSVRVTFDGWNDVRLTSITTSTFTDSIYSYDEDWTSASYEGFSELMRDRRTFSQEFRLDSAADAPRLLGLIDRWTLGAFASVLDEQTPYTSENPSRINLVNSDLTLKNFALYGQAARDLTSKDRLTLGLRAEHIDAEGNGNRARYRKALDVFDRQFAFGSEFDDTLVGGKLTWEHDLTQTYMFFASVARGYKAGGVNVDPRISPADGDPTTYDTEQIWNYETGVRARWDRVTASITGFYMDRSNTQVRDSAGFGGDFRFFTDNGDESYIVGTELEATMSLTDEWFFYGTLGTMSSDIDTFRLTNNNIGGGRELAHTPSYTWSLGTRYQHSSGLFATLDITGRDDYFQSNNQNERLDSFTNVNASIGYAKDGWMITLWARNLLNEDYAQRVFFFGNEEPDFDPARYESLAPAQQIGVTIRRDF